MAEAVNQVSRAVPVLKECDVLVIGAGVGGINAAVCAARAGADVVLVEKNFYPGGVATASLMCSTTNYFFQSTGERIAEGFAKEFLDDILKEGGHPYEIQQSQPQIPWEPEAFKRVAIRKLHEAGVTTLYGCTFVESNLKENNLESCVFWGRERFFAVKAKEVIDATGEMYVFCDAGYKVPFSRGFDSSSLLFRMRDVNIDKFINWLEAYPENYSQYMDIPTPLDETIRLWREKGIFHLPHGGARGFKFIREDIKSGKIPVYFGKYVFDFWKFGLFADKSTGGTVIINSNVMTIRDYDEKKLSDMGCEARLLFPVMEKYIRENVPGFENARILHSADEIGRRVNRHFIGKTPVQQVHTRFGAVYEDSIGKRSDVLSLPDGVKIRSATGAEFPLSGLFADFPANAAIASGKHISGMRGQMCCMMIGQAAGVACAVAAAGNIPVNRVCYRDVRRILKEQKVMIK